MDLLAFSAFSSPPSSQLFDSAPLKEGRNKLQMKNLLNTHKASLLCRNLFGPPHTSKMSEAMPVDLTTGMAGRVSPSSAGAGIVLQEWQADPTTCAGQPPPSEHQATLSALAHTNTTITMPVNLTPGIVGLVSTSSDGAVVSLQEEQAGPTPSAGQPPTSRQHTTLSTPRATPTRPWNMSTSSGTPQQALTPPSIPIAPRPLSQSQQDEPEEQAMLEEEEEGLPSSSSSSSSNASPHTPIAIYTPTSPTAESLTTPSHTPSNTSTAEPLTDSSILRALSDLSVSIP